MKATENRPQPDNFGLTHADIQELQQLRDQQRVLQNERALIQEKASQTSFKIGGWIAAFAGLVYFYSSDRPRSNWNFFNESIWDSVTVVALVMGMSFLFCGVAVSLLCWVGCQVVFVLSPFPGLDAEIRTKLEMLCEYEVALAAWKSQLRAQDIDVISAFGECLEKLKDFSAAQLPSEKNLPCSPERIEQAIDRLSVDKGLPQKLREVLPVARAYLTIYSGEGRKN
jgi:hypothetical protein